MDAGRPDERDEVRLDLVGDADPADLVAEREEPRRRRRPARSRRAARRRPGGGGRSTARRPRPGSRAATRTRKRSSCAWGRAKVPSNSIGFWVARTTNGSGSGRVVPSIETWRSCIASSSAAWVRGVARLISSTRRMFVKTGPGANRSGAALVEAGAGDVDRQEVRRALDPVRSRGPAPGRPPGRGASCRFPGRPRRGRGRRRGAPSGRGGRGASAPTTAGPTAASIRSSRSRRAARAGLVEVARAPPIERRAPARSPSWCPWSAPRAGRRIRPTALDMDRGGDGPPSVQEAYAVSPFDAAIRRRTAGRIPPFW